ncbi:hypothetical protein PR048_007196 [Dryococelus australis]|uniref:Uncharacterized protein n=1 Tax=Dryococelus australis TaxID=614101 RepID=A0ABQ9ID02_9NEOP|nr:hypothetical protein PR048_007196 [Dryococelus australis]
MTVLSAVNHGLFVSEWIAERLRAMPQLPGHIATTFATALQEELLAIPTQTFLRLVHYLPRRGRANHEILVEQHFYIGTKIKLDPASGLGSFDLGSGKMLVQPGIRDACRIGPARPTSLHLASLSPSHAQPTGIQGVIFTALAIPPEMKDEEKLQASAERDDRARDDLVLQTHALLRQAAIVLPAITSLVSTPASPRRVHDYKMIIFFGESCSSPPHPPPPRRTRFDTRCGVAPGFSHVRIVPDDAAGRRVFSGIFRFPRPFIPALPPTSLHPSSAHKTSMYSGAWHCSNAIVVSSTHHQLRLDNFAGCLDWEPNPCPQEFSSSVFISAPPHPERLRAYQGTAYKLTYNLTSTDIHALPRIRTQNLSYPRQVAYQPTAPREVGCTPGHSGFSHVGIVPDDAAGLRVSFEVSRFPRPFIKALLHTHLTSPPSALKTSMLRAAHIS